jgi:hypothetical protein
MMTSSLESAFWTSGQHRGYAVTDVIGGRVDIAVDVELYGDQRSAVLTGGLDEAYALDTGHALFDELGDAGLHHVRRGPRIGRLHGNHGGIDIRVLAQRQALEGDQAEGDQQQGDHRREHRAGHGDIGEQH